MQFRVDSIERNMKAEMGIVPMDEEELKLLTVTQRVKRIERMFSDQTTIIELL